MISFIKRYPVWVWITTATAAGVVVSTLLAFAIGAWIQGSVSPADPWIGVGVAAVIIPAMGGSFFQIFREWQRAEAKLLVLANEDSLTQVFNRRRFMEILENEWSRARRYDRPLTLLLLDADHFKVLNDDHGHLAGDAGLRHIARTCQGALRSMDVIGRFGGEEFLILLPETPSASGVLVAERIRQALAEKPVLFQGSQIPLTVSIGVSANRYDCPDAHTLLLSADQALYRAKAAGRNCVAFSHGEGAVPARAVSA